MVKPVLLAGALVLAALLGSCARQGPRTQAGHTVDGASTTNSPNDLAFQETERGQASWYGPRFHGRRTASGERYDQRAFTAAHQTLPFGTVVRLRNVTGGQEVEVRINDRGPRVRGRIVDVSRAAAEALGLIESGVGTVLLLQPVGTRSVGARLVN